MGSPISRTLAEIYLQYLEEIFVKQCLEKKEITYYKRYVDDLLIIFVQNKINADTIYSMINNIDKHLEFKISQKTNNTINYLHFSVNRTASNIELKAIENLHTWISLYTSPPTIHLIKNRSLHLLYQQNDLNAHHGTSEKTGMEKTNQNGPKQRFPQTYNPWFEKKLTTKIDRTKQTQQQRKNGSPLHTIPLWCIRLITYSSELTSIYPSAIPTQYCNNFHKKLIVPNQVEYINLKTIHAIRLT